jgi:hypothetical protein
MRLPPRLQGRITGIWIFASYVTVFVLVCLPWLRMADRAVPLASPIARPDSRLILWILWWVAHSLGTNPAGIVDAPINYPVAAQLTGSEHFGTSQLVFAPVYFLSGNIVVAANATLFLAYPLTALAMNRLLAALGFRAAIAWTVGFAFALGALQVAAGVHNLHVIGFFPAAAALTLHRLRAAPSILRGGLFGLTMVAALLASYYTAAIVLIVVVIWGTAEALRPLPGTRRFVSAVIAVTGASILVLLVASIPYLSRGEVSQPTEVLEKHVRVLTALHGYAFLSSPVHFLGIIAIALGLVGAVDRSAGPDRWIRRLGLALFVAGALLAAGAARGLLSLPESLPFAALLSAPARFFRMSIRFAALAGFGLALLAALGLQRIDRRLPRFAAWIVFAAFVAGTWYERGSRITFEPLEAIAAAGADAPIYRQVKAVVDRRGRGPLLELPLRSPDGLNLQGEAMIGATWHELPLVTGHTGYPPPQRTLIDSTILRLPAPDALQDLVDMTHLRWILLRPNKDWASPVRRQFMLRRLQRIPGVGPVLPVQSWTLIGVDLPSRHAAWFDAIASGGGRDRTILGAPLRALDPARSASRISLDLPEAAPPGRLQVEAGESMPIGFRVENLGGETWPVAGGSRELVPWSVELSATWRAIDRAGETALRAVPIALPRDVPPAESVRVHAVLTAPSEPGRFVLGLKLQQVGEQPFPPAVNPPLEVRVDVSKDARERPEASRPAS